MKSLLTLYFISFTFVWLFVFLVWVIYLYRDNSFCLFFFFIYTEARFCLHFITLLLDVHTPFFSYIPVRFYLYIAAMFNFVSYCSYTRLFFLQLQLYFINSCLCLYKNGVWCDIDKREVSIIYNLSCWHRLFKIKIYGGFIICYYV